ncbi:dicarboxylate/amino acid:cation symporter [bacterium]|nr:dicarboxylate/amino acid:cation symporter [bacterium]
MRTRSRFPLHYQTLLAMVLGAAVGSFAGPSIAPLGKLGSVLIQMVKALATPLLFVVLLDSFSHAAIRGKTLARLLFICAINSTAAILIGMALCNLWQPGTALRDLIPESAKMAPPPKVVDLWQTLLGYVPQNLLQPFLEHSVMGIILLAILFGLSLQTMKREGVPTEGASKVISWLMTWLITAVHWVVKISPLAVFAVVAQAVGEKGIAPLTGLAGYVACAVAGMALQVFLVYQFWIRVVCKMPLRKFWAAARWPVSYSFGVNSSLATLPLTFDALDELKVSKEAARVGAGLGTNFNNDGILLYEAMAVILVTQAYGMHLSFFAQLGLAMSCLIAALGVAGVPEAGLIALTLVLSHAGIPMEILPLLLTVDWIVARCRSATNVVGDLAVSIALDRKPAERLSIRRKAS